MGKVTPSYFLKSSKFWPRFVVLKFLHSLSLNCSKLVLVSIMSIIHFETVINTIGTVLIFISAHSVFLTAEKPTMNHHM